MAGGRRCCSATDGGEGLGGAELSQSSRRLLECWQRADPYRRPTLEVTVAYVAAAGKEEETMESAAAAATEADWGAAAEEAGRGYILGSASDAVNWRSAMMSCAITLPPSSAISIRRCFAEISKTGGLPRHASHVDLLSGHGAVEDAVEIIPKLETASKIDSLARKGIAKVFPIQEGHGHKGAREITHLDSWPRAHYHKRANYRWDDSLIVELNNASCDDMIKEFCDYPGKQLGNFMSRDVQACNC